jgi:PqqD family protein of HPr-rel-A system
MAWRHFGDGCVVYHRPSGKTHFLNEPSARLLLTVLRQPTSVSAAASALAFEDPAPAYVAAVADLLLRLEELGLVARVDA